MISIQKIIFKTRYFDRRIYLFLAAILGIVVFDMYAVSQSMYYHFLWLDIPVHLVAGGVLAFLLYYLVFANLRTATYFNQKCTRRQVFSTMVFWVLVVAISWEIVEFLYGRTILTPNYALDLFLDISVTTLGAVLVYICIRYYKNL